MPCSPPPAARKSPDPPGAPDSSLSPTSRTVMNFGYTIDTDRKLIFQVFEGRFSIAQLIACTRRMWSDPAYSKTYPGVVDISRMTPSAGLDDLTLLIDFLKLDMRTSTGRWAVITSSPAATAGSMIYKRRMAGHHVFEVFSTWESAFGFLQLEPAGRPAIPFLTDIAGPDSDAPPMV